MTTVDIDVLLGHYPTRPEPRGTPDGVRAQLAAHDVGTAALAHLRSAIFDVASGNDEVLAAAGSGATAGPALEPVGTVDLRDPIGAEREIERLVARGVRVLRLFPVEQHVEADFPAVRHVARRATEAGLLILSGGDVRRFWRPFAEARVVFLDTHFYHLGDFLVVARDEPGFHTSTRLLTSPDALETVTAEVGAERLVHGSRAPFYEPGVPLLRLRRSELSAEQAELVRGGNASRLLAESGVRR